MAVSRAALAAIQRCSQDCSAVRPCSLASFPIPDWRGQRAYGYRARHERREFRRRLGFGRLHDGAGARRSRLSAGSTSGYFLYWEDADLCRRLRIQGALNSLRSVLYRRAFRRGVKPRRENARHNRVPSERLHVLCDSRRKDGGWPWPRMDVAEASLPPEAAWRQGREAAGLAG